ncbi:hypothetical protein BGX24_007244 [Mortierella sp. AD032]|nr:hypothetical protein BGX24_007244 [Mortierella sp. AD032]
MDDHSDFNEQFESNSSTNADHSTDTDVDEEISKSMPNAKASPSPVPRRYNYVSSPEYPNGKVVETVELLPSDDALRARSTGWSILRHQSFRSLVLRDIVVK